jgi:hypothetical protein
VLSTGPRRCVNTTFIRTLAPPTRGTLNPKLSPPPSLPPLSYFSYLMPTTHAEDFPLPLSVPCQPPLLPLHSSVFTSIERDLTRVNAVTLGALGGSGSLVGWGTKLQAGRSRVRFPMKSLDFSIDVILPAAPWPSGWLSL